jgi:hypothetical protein
MPELVAFGVTAEIIVVVENEDARSRSSDQGAKEVSGRQTTDTPADDDEVVAFARIGDVDVVPRLPCRHRVRHFPRAVVASAHPGEARWIAIFLCGKRGHRRCAHQCSSQGDADTIEKIPPRD